MLKLIAVCAVALFTLTGCTVNINVPEPEMADSGATPVESESASPEPTPVDKLKGEICAGTLDQFESISASDFTTEAMVAAYREMARLVSTDPRIAEHSAQIEQLAATLEQGDTSGQADEAFRALDAYCVDAP